MQKTTKRSVTLWIIQGVLAALFLFAGASKLVMPIEVMTQQIALPGAFLRFIGVAEVAGALGLVLPGIFRIRQWLTPLAAVGLVTIMTGATTLTLEIGGGAGAAMPFVVGLLAAFVARERWPLVASRWSLRPTVYQRAR